VSKTQTGDTRHTQEGRRAYLAKRADEEFKDHVLVKEGEGRWFCGKPGTGIYSFRVLTAPGALIVYGDIYDAVLKPSDRDALAWLRGSMGSLDYVLEKVTACADKRREFLRGEALRELAEMEQEHPERAARIRAAWEHNRDWQGEERAWIDALSAEGMDVEGIPDDHDSQLLWQYHGLRHFCRLLDERDKADKAMPIVTAV
jgi:predicted secreted protein